MIRTICWAFFGVLAFAAFASAAEPSYALAGSGVGAGLGAALTIIGAGYGFGKIGAAALESMARQPEVAGQVQTGMIIIGALLEGATFFALIVCILVSGNAKF
ncbi:MAG: ATP synthase F0 subunit C [Planctomycetia bacterium]|nr:ATP synthase F0 subunit C [Planctomycetia bacterium]